MKRLIILVFSLVLIATLAVGCNSGTTISASLGRQFTLSIGQTASISSEKLDIKFLDITEDSRCPKDVTCIWAGQVSCALKLKSGGKAESVKLTQPGLADAGSRQKLGAYTYIFNVEPYPESGREIQKKDYLLLMTVMK
jgi:hypothetical protein